MALITSIVHKLAAEPLWWLTGPILDKELRVSSRRKRTYVLRFFYIIFLLIFMLWVWWVSIEMYSRFGQTSKVYQISRLPEAGKMIVATITWFQFIAAQLIALSMMSTAFNDEIRKRTLGTLLVTPITSWQIVMGKLLGGLCKVLILLAISLPLLALVRVFGGIPWNYVVSSLGMTVASMLLTAAVSLFFSVTQKRSHHVMARVFWVFVFVYLVVPWGLIAIWEFKHLHFQTELMMIITHMNPLFAMTVQTRQMMTAGMTGLPFYAWWLYCVIALGATLVVALLATWRVRTTGHRLMVGAALGESAVKGGRRKSKHAGGGVKAVQKIRRVVGMPVAWKEVKAPQDIKRGRSKLVVNVLALLLLCILYGIGLWTETLDNSEYQVSMVLLYMGFGFLAAGSYAANSVTAEKEAQTWPILLLTTLEGWQITMGKIIGSMRRTTPIWFLLGLHLLIFIGLGYIHPASLLHLPAILLSGLVYFSTSGVCFSIAVKKSSAAMVLTFGLALFLGLFVPMISAIGPGDTGFAELVVSVNPLVQGGAVMDATSGGRHAHYALGSLIYDLPSEQYSFFEATFVFYGTLLFYGIIGFFFFAIATGMVRRGQSAPLPGPVS